jgi:hypothetical protein
MVANEYSFRGGRPLPLLLVVAHDRDLKAVRAHRRRLGARYRRDLLLRVVRRPDENRKP